MISFLLNKDNIVAIDIPNASNYKQRKYDIEFALDIANLHIANWEKEVTKPNGNSCFEIKTHYTMWIGANRLSVKAMERTIVEIYLVVC